MNKKFIIPSVIVGLLLIGGIVFLAVSLGKQKQANKDYTHINHKGGRRLAGEFVKSLEYSLNRNGL